MSTYWGYVCQSHDPPLTTDHWVNHGERLLADVFHKVRAEEWPVDEFDMPAEVDMYGDGHYMSMGPVYWLWKHPRCQIALHNEYGDVRPVDAIVCGEVVP